MAEVQAMPTIATPRRKRRPASACESCRKKKVKCDRHVPCGPCLKTGNEYCQYLFADQAPTYIPAFCFGASTTKSTLSLGTSKTGNKQRVGLYDAKTLKASNRTINPTHTRHQSGIFPTPPKHSLSQKYQIARPQTQQGEEKPSTYNEQDLLPQVSDTAIESEVRQGIGRAASAPVTGKRSHSPVRGIFLNQIFFGQSHWTSSAHQFPEVFKILRSLEENGENETRALYKSCEELITEVEVLNQPALKLNLHEYIPQQAVANQLVQAYLRTFETVFRIIHIPTFLKEYELFWIDIENATEEFMIQLILILALGKTFCPDIVIEGFCAASWIAAAQSWLGGPTDESRITLAGIQVHCLLLLARQSNNVGADFIWISAGTLLRAAMHLGLHIDPTKLPIESFYEQEIRRRLWATVLEITIQSAMDSGGLPLISSKDFDCCNPTNISDEDFDMSTSSPPTEKPSSHYTQASCQIALMDSLPIRLKIVQVVNDFRSECSYEEVLRLGAQISVHGKLKRFLVPKDDQPLQFSISFVELLTLRFLLALHHPFAMRARNDKTLYFSRKVSLEVSLCLLTRFSPRNHPPGEQDFARLGLTGAGIFRNVPVQAANSICADLICQHEEEALSYMSLSNSFSNLNAHNLIVDYVNLLDLRLKLNETTIHGCLKFAALVAQIEALQTGSPIEKGISEALRRALEDCHTILQERVKPSGLQVIEVNPLDHNLEEMVMDAGETPSWLNSDNNTIHPEMLNFDSWLNGA